MITAIVQGNKKIAQTKKKFLTKSGNRTVFGIYSSFFLLRERDENTSLKPLKINKNKSPFF